MEERWVIHNGDCCDVLPTIAKVDHVLTDPPYHPTVNANGRRLIYAKKGNVVRDEHLGFDGLLAGTRDRVAREIGRLCARWCLVFTDVESCHLWRLDLQAHGVEHIRQGTWVKLCCQPQLTGDRPAAGAEAVQISHRKGRKEWNGGGLPAVWTFPIERGDRVHTTQKPLDLMLRLVEQFTDPDDLVLDPFCGSGTTGVACLRLGRRFIGIERDEKYHAVATERLKAEENGLTLRDARAGQMPMFGKEQQ